ncbi:hypothetical protein [Paenibacillus sp. R14(2021)]|uniref:hypothetical protein n=1 Tax=Paenibacillus sp. R14(2021) TaxID=2859228 RepID=UPI001C6139D4|nr:hypothetical protein [Paenibacillus sp. R14(2021)]
MKWSGFLIGALAGAATAAYMAKKRPGMFAWASSAAGNTMTGFSKRAMGAMLSRKFGSDASHDVSPKHSSVSAKESGNAWGQIEMLLNSDPSVKDQVEDIKSEAKTH